VNLIPVLSVCSSQAGIIRAPMLHIRVFFSCISQTMQMKDKTIVQRDKKNMRERHTSIPSLSSCV
jgi:hypothetical protein